MNRLHFGFLVCLIFTLALGWGHSRERGTWISWEDPLLLRTGNASLGPWRMNQSRWKYVDDPGLDLVGSDTGGFVWVNQSKKDVFFQPISSPDTKPSRPPVNVSRSPKVFSWLPEVVVDPDSPENIYVLWQEIVFSGGSHGGEIFFSRSTNGGLTFQSPLNLSQSKAGDGKGRLSSDRWDNGSLDLVQGPTGNLYAAWTEYEGRLWVARSTNEGQSFSDPRLIAGQPPTPPARAPSLAANEDGDLHLAWTVGERNQADVRIQRLNQRGYPVGPVSVHSTDGHSDVPKVEVDSSGTVHLVYRESPSGPLRQYHVRYVQWLPSEESFTAPVQLSRSGGGTVYSSDLELSREGHPYALWETSNRRDQRPNNLVLTRSSDGGASFDEPISPPGTREARGINGSLQGRLSEKLELSGKGTLAVVNSVFRRGDRSAIYLYYGTVSNPSSPLVD